MVTIRKILLKAQRMIEHNKESNCHDCYYAEGPTGTEGCGANPRALCYMLSGELKMMKRLVTTLEQIAKDNSSVHSNLAQQALKEYKEV